METEEQGSTSKADAMEDPGRLFVPEDGQNCDMEMASLFRKVIQIWIFI